MSAAPKPSAATPFQTALSWFPVHDFFSVDLRSLALLRLGLGIMLLLEWLNRLVDVRMHYSDDGVVPRELINQTGTPISVFMLSGSAWFAGALMIVGCVLAVLLCVGWRTQFITLLSWFLLIGVQGRNFAIMQGGDVVMRMLLFWAIFLPLGACYSLDALRAPLRDWRPRLLSVGSVAYIVQMCLIYWFAAAWKTDPAWRTDHTAVYLALSIEGFTTSFGHLLLHFPNFLKFLTLATMVLETFGPAVLFIPFANGPLRTLVVVSFILFHMGLGMSLELGNFPPICCVAWLAVLPTWFWDQLEARLSSARRSGMVIYFNADNAWHRKCVEAVRLFLLLYETKMIPAQEAEKRQDSIRGHQPSSQGITKKPHEVDTLLSRLRAAGPWLVVDSRGREYAGYEALVRMVQVSFLFWPFADLLKWGPIRRWGEQKLRRLAARPAKLFRVTPATSDWPGARLGGWTQNAIGVFFIVYLVAWNIRTLDFSENQTKHHDEFPEQMNSLAYALGLDQSWGLFAPKPGNVDGWYIIPAVLENGKVVDLYRDGAELTTEKPRLVSATYTNTRTRKYMMNLSSPGFAHLRPYYARYICKNWNDSHGPDEQIKYMFIIYMLKRTQPDRQVDEATEMRLQNWPVEPMMVDPITKEPFPTQSLAAGLGLGGPPRVIAEQYNRPVLPQLMQMKDRR
jgi:hypothetical protein